MSRAHILYNITTYLQLYVYNTNNMYNTFIFLQTYYCLKGGIIYNIFKSTTVHANTYLVVVFVTISETCNKNYYDNNNVDDDVICRYFYYNKKEKKKNL